MGEAKEVFLPANSNAKELSQNFSDFFTDKIDSIRSSIIASNQSFPAYGFDELEASFSGDRLEEFVPATTEEVKHIVLRSPNKSCEIDPIPTWLLKECLHELSPIITKIINLSMENSHVPRVFKSSRIRPDH